MLAKGLWGHTWQAQNFEDVSITMVSVSTVQPSINLEFLCTYKNLKMPLYTLLKILQSTDFHIWKVMHEIRDEWWKNSYFWYFLRVESPLWYGEPTTTLANTPISRSCNSKIVECNYNIRSPSQASRVPRVRNILHMVEKFAEDGCSLIVGCAATGGESAAADSGSGTGQQPPFCIQTLFKGLCLNRA